MIIPVSAAAQESPGTPKLNEHQIENQTCLECHQDKDIQAQSERGKSLKLHVESKALLGSVHEELRCTDCHGGAKDWEEAPHNDGKPLVLKCDECHQEEAREYETNCIHGKVRKEKNPNAPYCQNCHGGHNIVPLHSKESVLSPLNQPTTCGKCHGSDVLNYEGGIAKRRLVDRYYSSVHWQSVKEGKPAATCSDCHGSHAILPSSDSASTVNRIGLLNACAKCHAGIVQTYSKGSHGRTLLHGNHDVPTCTTCHGDHDMTSLKTQAGGTRNFSGTQICIWCHGNERMMSRYALDTSPVESYMKDFHGLTQRGTGGTSATCADCHDAHNSLPSSHPESRMHISNRGAACGICHGKTSDNFIMSFTHKTVGIEQGGEIKQVVVTIYIILILVIVGGMLFHNGIIWSYSLRKKIQYQKWYAKIVRFNRFEKLWHLSLFLSFFLLVVTGFALKFPDSVWFQWLYSLGLSEGARAWIHRFAAAALSLTTLLFLFYQVVNSKGRRWFKEMLPRRVDFSDFFKNMVFHLGREKVRPRFGMFSYIEKVEYWALMWGTLIMVCTGLILWFPKSLPGSLPSWVIDLARTIHFYEAVLASLSILVWHFFHTIFKPDEYPMDTSWWTGMLTQHEAERRFTDSAIQDQRPSVSEKRAAPEPMENPEWESGDTKKTNNSVENKKS